MHARARSRSTLAAAVLLVTLAAAAPASARSAPDAYTVHPLVSNLAGAADHMDPNLVNAWGLSAGPSTPWWVADNGSDLSTLYNAAGTPLPLVVSVPGAPTGTVFNGTSGFPVAGNPAAFIFDTEGGTILGWNGGGAATVEADNSPQGAVFKGLAIADSPAGTRIYATDFHNGVVDVFNSAWQPVSHAGFVDPSLPRHFAPFGIQAIGDRIFVTYAKQQAGSDDEAHGQGLGLVDVFDPSGHLRARVAQFGHLNAPWGIAQAPRDFGRFGGDLLVGNFGDGRITAYREAITAFRARGSAARAIGPPAGHRWPLGAPVRARQRANNGPADTLFFTAGPNDEMNGLFGTIRVESGH